MTNQEIFVQVIKEPFAGKGPRVTTEVAIPGRLLVLVPYENYIGISKKIWDKFERRRLKKIARGLGQKDTGIIIISINSNPEKWYLNSEIFDLMLDSLEINQ